MKARTGLRADRIVPPQGAVARLVGLASAAMVFLAVLALAMAMAMLKLGAAWQTELADTVTLTVPADEPAELLDAALHVLETTPGVASTRVLPDEDLRALLAPWFGRDLPLDALPLPRMVAVTADGLDTRNLSLRLAAEAPGVRLDDHDLWRAPLAAARARMRVLAAAGTALIFATLAAVTALAAQASVAANGRVIAVLRLVGARDGWIARGFVRRITLRALVGGITGAALAMGALAAFPATGPAGLPGLRPTGSGWLPLALTPGLAAGVALVTTRLTVRALLKGSP